MNFTKFMISAKSVGRSPGVGWSWFLVEETSLLHILILMHLTHLVSWQVQLKQVMHKAMPEQSSVKVHNTYCDSLSHTSMETHLPYVGLNIVPKYCRPVVDIVIHHHLDWNSTHALTKAYLNGNNFKWYADIGVKIPLVLPLYFSSAICRNFSHNSPIALPPANWYFPL